jgi:hypothetical protein
MGLNASSQLTDKFRIGAQVYDRNLGQLGQWHPSLDWGSGRKSKNHARPVQRLAGSRLSACFRTAPARRLSDRPARYFDCTYWRRYLRQGSSAAPVWRIVFHRLCRPPQ